jgi:hypothetical protein
MKNKFISIFIIASFVLAGTATVSADQLFLFSDDLSAQFDIDQGQTAAKFISGRFYTADDSVSSAVASKIVANPFKAIISARLDVSASIPSGTMMIYYLSNNKGLRWTQVNPGYTYTFDSVGNELRWRAVIARESPFVASGYIDSVHITYTVSDSITPSPSTSSNSGSLSTVLYGGGGDLNLFVCDILASIGLGCGVPQKVATPIYESNIQTAHNFSQQKNSSQERLGQQTNAGNSLQASIANVTIKRTVSDDEVILVKIPATNGIKQTFGLSTNDAIFEIIRGQKHFIPTVDIFFDYGFDLSAVQSVTHKDLEPFPRTKLVNIYDDDSKKIYYITEGHMIRLIPNDRVFESYGDREEDIITISKKEFNFYPRNQYVFLENPLSATEIPGLLKASPTLLGPPPGREPYPRDIYQVVSDGTKRYVTPQVMRRLRIKQDQVAPINQAQLNSYQNDQPIIF